MILEYLERTAELRAFNLGRYHVEVKGAKGAVRYDILCPDDRGLVTKEGFFALGGAESEARKIVTDLILAEVVAS